MQVTMTVVYSSEGKLLNFGPWDYQIQEFLVNQEKPELGAYQVVGNPLPEGAIVKDVVITIPELGE